MTLRRRVLSVIILALAGLIPLQASLAQAPGSELTEEVAAHEVGENAQVRLEDVAAFDPGGGDAIFEPGTSNEEAFSYDSIDAETNRLIGLTRDAPLDHPVGTFVEAVGQEPPPSVEPSPGPTEQPEEAPSSPGGGESSEEATPSQSASDPDQSSSDAATSEEAPGEAAEGDICLSNRPAQECLNEIVGEVCAEGLVCDIVGELLTDPCGDAPTLCEAVMEIVDDLETGDPCDPDNTGQTCLEYVQAIIDDLEVGDPCDPDNTGQTCADYVANEYEETCAPLFNWQQACRDIGEQTVGCLASAGTLADCAQPIVDMGKGLVEQLVNPQPGQHGETIIGSAVDENGDAFVRCTDHAFIHWADGPGPKLVYFGGAVTCVGSLPPAVIATGYAQLHKFYDYIQYDPDNPFYVFHDFTLPYVCAPCNNNVGMRQKPHLAFVGDRFQVRHHFVLGAAPGSYWAGSHPGCAGYGTPVLTCEKAKVYTITRDGNLPE